MKECKLLKAGIKWIRVNKRRIIITGLLCLSPVVIATIVNCFSKNEVPLLEEIYNDNVDLKIDASPFRLMEDPYNVPSVKAPHAVSPHIRNLHEGYHASEDKILSAAENGFSLKEGQTWVRPYTTGEHLE